MKNQFYVVSQMEGLFVGRIFDNWSACQTFMEGHKGLRHKGFPTEMQARIYLAEEEQRYVEELENGLHGRLTDGAEEEQISRKTVSKKREIYDSSQNVSTDMRDLPLTEDQQKALTLMESGQNVFLTGSAGTGKSYVLQRFIRSLRKQKKRALVCAPTGIAAINVNGITIHRAFGAPLGAIDPRKRVKQPDDLVINADVIIIDEISMCRIDLFEYVMKSVARAEELARKREEDKPGGGRGGRSGSGWQMRSARGGCWAGAKQIVLVGDFFQLPPVVRREDRMLLQEFYPDLPRDSFGFPFQSPLWIANGFRMAALKQVVRQEEQDFVEALNLARMGDAASIDYFQSHCSPVKLEGGIELYGRNNDVKRANEQGLSQLEAEEHVYTAEKAGTVKPADQPTEEVLRLKEGCRVMLLVNDSENRYQNGSLGNVKELFTDSIRICLDNGREVDVEPYTWSIKGLGQVMNDEGEMERALVEIGTFTQFPLKLAYAVTIHKSQGQTYDKVNLNPQAWDAGQLYVALSRVRAAENLHLYRRIIPGWLIASPEVRAFYEQEMGNDCDCVR